jgi:hypothetical protein
MSWIKNRAIKVLTKMAGQTDAGWFFPLSFGSSLFSGSNKQIYKETAILSSVINKRAQCFGNSVVYVKDKKGNEPDGLFSKRIRLLFDRPNPFMSWEQLYRTTEMYRMLYGYCVWLKLSATEKEVPSSLYIIDPDQLQIDFDRNSPFIGRNEAKRIRIGGRETDLTLNDLIIFNDIKTGFSECPFFAESRMSALKNESKLLKVIADAEFSIIRNRGALGILAKDGRDSSPVGVYDDSIKSIQEQYKRYGITSEQWNIIITSVALKWYPISQPLKDLMLPEFEEQTAKKICALFDVPFELFPFSKDSAFGNGGSRKQSFLELYQNTIIPASNGDARLLTQSLCGGTELVITLDYSDMYIFQEDMKQKAETANTAITAFNAAQSAGNITREEWRRMAAEYLDIDPSAALVEEKIMLAQRVGVGGLQAIISLVTDANLPDAQKRALLVKVFDFTPEEALETIPEIIMLNN